MAAILEKYSEEPGPPCAFCASPTTIWQNRVKLWEAGCTNGKCLIGNKASQNYHTREEVLAALTPHVTTSP